VNDTPEQEVETPSALALAGCRSYDAATGRPVRSDQQSSANRGRVTAGSVDVEAIAASAAGPNPAALTCLAWELERQANPGRERPHPGVVGSQLILLGEGDVTLRAE